MDFLCCLLNERSIVTVNFFLAVSDAAIDFSGIVLQSERAID